MIRSRRAFSTSLITGTLAVAVVLLTTPPPVNAQQPKKGNQAKTAPPRPKPSKANQAGAKRRSGPGAAATGRTVRQGTRVPTTNKPPRNTVPPPTVKLKPGEVPAIQFDTPVYNFGRVRAGQEVRHDFWFTNTGTGPLEILRVKPS